MTEAMKRAIELAQHLPDEEQDALAHLMLEEMQAAVQWKNCSTIPGLRFSLSAWQRQRIRSIVLGLREPDVMVWFWIGSHAEYDKLIAQL